MAKAQRNKNGYPVGWTGVIARRLAHRFDVSENTIRNVAKGKSTRKDILDAIVSACAISSQLKNL